MLGLVVVQGIGRGSAMSLRVKQVYAVKRSKYQEIVVADVEDFGRSLILDGYIQSSEADEYIYHESLVHPALLLHPKPTKVLIIGGGEGAALREVLKHKTVNLVVMVDIDSDVIEISKEYLPSFHRSAFHDPRTRIIIEDGLKFVLETKEIYDVVILDLTDPYSSDIARQLYSDEFYKNVYRILTDDGIMVTQAGSAFFYRDVYYSIVNSVKNIYRHHLEYQVWIPSFGYACNFVLGSKRYDPVKHLRKEHVDYMLQIRGVETKFINGVRLESLVNMGVY